MKLEANPRLAAYVVANLEQLWSPEQIEQRLITEFPDDPEMRVSHETIYQSLYVQGRGALRKELASCLRTGRAVRRPRDQRHGGPHRRHGQHLGAARRGRGPGRARSLGRRPDHRQRGSLSDRHPGRAEHPFRDVVAPP